MFDKYGNLQGATCNIGRLSTLIQKLRKTAASMTNNFRRIHRMGVMQKLNCQGTQGVKDLYQYLRRSNGTPSSVVRHPVTGKCIFEVEKQHEVMIEPRQQVYGKHKNTACTWQDFLQEYGEYEPGLHDAPAGHPTAEQRYSRAQRAKDASSAGSDGFAPKELRTLPLRAWEHRQKVVALMTELQRYPEAYYTVNTPAIPKKGKGQAPLDHRLLAVFSSLYRIEAGAWFELLQPWLKRVLHPNVVGAIAGLEAYDIAWDAQYFLERALLRDESVALISLDYEKYFDSFQHEWTRNMLVHMGVPAHLANMTFDLYTNMKRVIKKGGS